MLIDTCDAAGMQSAVGYNMHYDYSHYADTCTAADVVVVAIVAAAAGGMHYKHAVAVDICRDYVHYMHCVHTCYTPGGSY